MNLRKELCENAMSVRSAQGGQCGHLGVVVPPNECNAMPGAQLRADPQNPGALQIPANAAAGQMALLSDTHNRQVKEHNARVDLATKLKQQILWTPPPMKCQQCTAIPPVSKGDNERNANATRGSVQ
jgi:hypothetical protein